MTTDGQAGLRVLHLAEGSGWAGIETHLLDMMSGLETRPDVDAVLGVFERGRLSEVVRERGMKEVLFDRGASTFQAVTDLIAYLRENAVDVVHMHGYLAVLLGAPAAALAGIPTRVVTLHASPEAAVGEGRKLRFVLWATYAVIRALGVFSIAVSNDLLERHIVVRRMRRERLHVVHNGIDEDLPARVVESSRADLGLDDGFLVGMVGRLDENKGHAFLLRAVAELLPPDMDIRVAIIGDGPSRKDLEEYCANAGIADRVSFLGFRTNVLDYLSRLDTLVIASLHEGVPYTLLEAMSLGVPVLATSVGGIPEVIEDSVTGLLIRPGSAEAVAEGVSRMVLDGELRDRLSCASSEAIQLTFSRTRMAEETVAVYRSLVGDGPRGVRAVSCS